MNVELLTYTPEPESVIAYSARICYESNNKEKKKTDGQLINLLIDKGHMSPIEHASATFEINGISRACSHQLVRHRLASFSQRSQRFVNEDEFDYIIPESVLNSMEDISEFESDMQKIQEMYKKWNQKIPNQDARFVLPNACSTHLTLSANFREFRHIFDLRCDKHAQWEIRNISREMLKLLYSVAPSIFIDQYRKFISDV